MLDTHLAHFLGIWLRHFIDGVLMYMVGTWYGTNVDDTGVGAWLMYG
jgi:hypothetical protein